MSSSPPIRFHPRDDSPWDLGHGLAAVGPGWWPMVREAFGHHGILPPGHTLRTG